MKYEVGVRSGSRASERKFTVTDWETLAPAGQFVISNVVNMAKFIQVDSDE